MQFYVSGGHFDSLEGCIWIFSFHEEAGFTLLAERSISPPNSENLLSGKGITGLCISAGRCFASFYDRVVELDILTLAPDGFPTFRVIGQFRDSDFNDLHGLRYQNGKLVVANTGNESIDTICLESRSVHRLNFLSDEMKLLNPRRGASIDTKPHLIHISDVMESQDGSLLASLVRQGRILNLTEWKWVGREYRAPLHDLFERDGHLFFTTVDGRIVVMQPNGTEHVHEVSKVVDDLGWVRGLLHCKQGYIVGSTAIRQSNSGYLARYTTRRVGQVEGSLIYVEFGTRSKTHRFLLGKKAKIFSICGALEDHGEA